jgi:putative restriction endonuclease
VLAAYDHRCAISNLPEDNLLDAAHIMADAHELLGQPVLPNGIALSKIHQAAFDNHLIGIDPDGRVHVSERLLALHDGPLLEQSLKAIAGRMIRLPRSSDHRPDRDRLAVRFEQFRRAG